MKLITHLILSLPLVGAYAIFAVGIVVIYRASRVLNLAHGAMAMVPAYVSFSLVRAHVPLLVAVLLGIASGSVLGLAVERIFVRGLRHLSLTAQTVGTVAVLSLLIALVAKIWGTAPQNAPQVFPEGHINVGSGILLYGAIGLFAVAVVLAVIMLAVFRYTDLGLAMRGAAENRRAAGLMGIDPDRTTALAWAIGGGLAGVAGILLASITTLDPFTLPLQTLPAFVAALLGGIDSVTGALAGAGAVGALLGLVPATSSLPVISAVTGQTGGPELALTIAALAVMYFRGQRFSVAIRDEAGFVAPRAPRSRRGRSRPSSAPTRTRRRRGSWLAIALVAWIWIPGVPFSVLANASQAMIYALVGVSLVVLTGWVGQISLGHAALVGIGAFGTGILARDLGVPFPFNLPLAAAMAAAAAALLGAVALRVRGLYLAVATLIFSWMADSFLFRSSWFVGVGGSSTIPEQRLGVRGGFPNFDFSDRKILYYFGLALIGLALLAAANLRSSKTGRAFFATRGSEMAAASLGIDVMRYKLLAFAISGFLAGIAGNLIMIDQRTIVPQQFTFTFSLFYLSIAVVGGLTRLTGVVFASLLFAGLNELFFRVTALGGYLEVVSAGLLVAAILAQANSDAVGRLWSRLDDLVRSTADSIRRGMRPLPRPEWAPARHRSGIALRAGKIADKARGALSRAGATRASASVDDGDLEDASLRAGAGAQPATTSSHSGPTIPRPRSVLDRLAPRLGRLMPHRIEERDVVSGSWALEPAAGRGNGDGRAASATRSESPAVLEARDVTVRFGGLFAVSEASLELRRGEIVGLIGPNGAGKTTLFNALSGLNEPTAGVVRLFGEDVSRLPVHERARRGLGRTFQVLQLFADLTVRDNLLVATHAHNRTGFIRHVLATDEAIRAERRARLRVQQIIDALDLSDVADRRVAGLPFGILRIVELGRAVVTESPIILLDEPASGLDNAETDRFTEFLRSLRDRFGITILLIEHDVRMVTGVSDYMYVLNMGRIIAQGPPERIKRDPTVIAAYLGESESTAGSVMATIR